MKKLLRILLAGMLLTGCQVFGLDGDDDGSRDWQETIDFVFDSAVIPEIHISVSREEWESLLNYFDADWNTQEYVKCDVEFRSGSSVRVIKDTGLRLKGNTSRRRPFGGKMGEGYHHAHFGLNFHKFVKDSKHDIKGIRKLDLKWFNEDPAYVREVYCFDLFRRAGVWTAINDVYCRLWLNVDGEEVYYGVYGLKEHIDKRYIKARKDLFDNDDDGNLWKCCWLSTGEADLKNPNADMGVDDNHTTHTYELKTNTEDGFSSAKAQLQDFIRNLNGLSGTAFDSWISTHMDVPLFLRTMAVNVAVGMWDDFWNNWNNYYLYFSTGEPYKVWYIPYDYDNTLGTSKNCGIQSDAGRQNPMQWGHQSAHLVMKILQNSQWNALYRQYLKDLCEGDFSYSASASRIKAWQDSVAPFVSNDTGEDMVMEDRPASWSNHPEYRLLEKGQNNFFSVKASVIANL